MEQQNKTEQQNILFHSLTEEWKSTELGPEFYDFSRPLPPEELPPPKDGDRLQDMPPKERLQDMPLQCGFQEPSPQIAETMLSQYNPQNISPQQRFQSTQLQYRPQDMQPIQIPQDISQQQQRLQDILQQSRPESFPLQQTLQQRLQSMPLQQRLQAVLPKQQLQDNMRYNATESTSFIDWPRDSFHTLKYTDIPAKISDFKSPDFKPHVFMDEVITLPKQKTEDLQALLVHLRNQLAQKDREIDTLRRNADMQRPELSCLKAKYSNLQQSFTTTKNQLDTARSMCLSLERNISEQTKEQELLKEQCEEQTRTIKSLQMKLQKKTTDIASLENALNIEQSRQVPSPEEVAAVAKYNAREEMAKRFKEDMEEQEKLLQLERSKNLETINRMQLTKSMFEEQKKNLEEENIQLRQLCEQLDINAQEMLNTIKSQQQQLTKKNDDLVGMENEMREIRMRNEEISCNYQKMIASLQADLVKKNNQHDELEAKLKETDRHSNQLQEKLSSEIAKVQKLTDENNMLKDSLKKANNEIQRENLEKQTNHENLVDAKQVMTSLKDKVDDLNLSHSKEINLLKQTISDLENIIARKDDAITEQQGEMSKIKYYIRSLEGEIANITEQARLEREKHKTLYEKASLLYEFLDKSSEILTEKQEEVWALKHQLEMIKRLSPVMEENEISQTIFQETSPAVIRPKDELKRECSFQKIEESSSYSIEDLKETVKYKNQCLNELTNTVIQMGLAAKQREAELQQEILQLKNVISMKERILSFREKELAKAQYELSINNARMREADITVHQKEIELEKERKKSKDQSVAKKNEESVKIKDEMQKPALWLSTIEKSENANDIESFDSQESCLIYETEIGSLKEMTKKGMKRERENYPITSTPSKVQVEITKQTDHASKIIKDLEELGENPPQAPSSSEIDSPDIS